MPGTSRDRLPPFSRPTSCGSPEVVVPSMSRYLHRLCAYGDTCVVSFCIYATSWWRGTVVERRSLTGELSLSHG